MYLNDVILRLPKPLRKPEDETGSGETPSAEETLTGGTSDGTEGKTDESDSGSLLGGDGAGTDAEGSDESEDSGFDLTPFDHVEFEKSLGDDSPFDSSALEGFAKIVNESTSRSEMAEGLLKLYEERETQAVQEIADEWENLQGSWRDAVKADKEIGGDNFETSVAKAREVIETYAPNPEALKEVLSSTGAGNNVEVIKLLVAVAKAIPGEAAPAEGTPGQTSKSLAERLFPKTA